MENLTIDSTREYTSEGFLKVSMMAAKTGIQEYLSDEIPVTSDKDIVIVRRTDSEVFSEDSLKSWKDVDITNRHPDSAVTTDNFNDVSVGHITSIGTKRGNHVLVEGIIKDGWTIKDIENGLVEVSAGYATDYIISDEEGVDFEQTNIRINHLAVVPKGRAKTALILDEDNGDVMELKEALQQIDELTAEVAELKKRPTIDAIGELIEVTKDATRINDEVDYKGLDLVGIKRMALGDSMDGLSDDVVAYAFDKALEVVVVEVVTTDSAPVLIGAEKTEIDYRAEYITNLKKGN